MKPFRFKNFNLQQHKDVFRVGTDGVLLGALANVAGLGNILEVGTGTGLIAMMIAQRNNNAKITAIDLNAQAVELASENFKASPFKGRIVAMQGDYKEFHTENKFDLIISNPPYFEANPSQKDIAARQQRELTFPNLISKTVEILAESGRFCVIIPSAAGAFFEQNCNANNLYLSRRITVYGNENVEPKRVILDFGFKEKQNITEEIFIIEKAPRVYSEQYLKETEQFHDFG